MTAELQPNQTLDTTWGLALEAVVCEQCDWSYLLPEGSLPQRCPHCFLGELTRIESDLQELPYTRPPELLLPFGFGPDRLAQPIENFARGIPFAPADLKPQNLQARLRRIYLPMWLVDAEVQAVWQAEAGFDYEVVSHQDRFDQNRGGWSSQQIKEGRIRWEPRLGRLKRTYNNVTVPALDEDSWLRKALGDFKLQAAAAYRAEAVQGVVRLPNRTPQDAWSDATPAFQAAATEECRLAAGANHIRQFRWQAQYHNQNWTLLLLPVYTTFYLDDERQPQQVLIHGQSGRIHGKRRASLQRAQTAALTTLAVAVVFFLLSLVLTALGVAIPPLLVIGGIGLVVALLVGFGALIPLIMVWQFNRSQPQDRST